MAEVKSSKADLVKFTLTCVAILLGYDKPEQPTTIAKVFF